MESTRTRWHKLPRRLRWSSGFAVGAAAQWAIGKLLDWVQPYLPSALTGVVSAMQWFLELVPPYVLLLLALGAALPYLAEKTPAMVSSLGNVWRGFLRPLKPSRHVFVAEGPTGHTVAKNAAPTQEVGGPITWEFGSNNCPIGTSRSAGAPLWVDAFQIKGQNTSDDPVHARKAEIRSDISGRKLPLQFSHDGKLLDANTITIPPEGKFTLIGRIQPTEPTRTLGVVVDQFREEFGAFTFTFEYGDPNYYYGEQTTFARRFPWAEVDKLLTNADVLSRRPNDRDIIIRKAPHYAAARTTPDYDKWDKQNVFLLFEAACLWNDEEPSLPMSEAAKATFNRFHAAIYDKT